MFRSHRRVMLVGLVVVIAGAACGSDPAAGGSDRPGAGGASGSGADGGASATTSDAGSADGSSSANDGATDGSGETSTSDASVPTLNPETCPVGPSDGCCPAAIRFGGTDPDCASLACSSFTKGAPIPLDVVEDGWQGEASAVWSGKELVIAWAKNELSPPLGFRPQAELVVQKRDATGNVTLPNRTTNIGQVTSVQPGPTAVELASNGELYFGFAVAPSQQYVGARIATNGDTSWFTYLGSLCNWGGMGLAVLPVSATDVVFAQRDYTCAGATYRPRATWLGATNGVREPSWLKEELGDGDRPGITAGAGFAFDPSSQRIFVAYGRDYESDARARFIELGSKTVSASTSLAGSTDFPRFSFSVAFDGQNYGVLVDQEYGINYSAKVWFRRYSPTAGWLGAPITIADYQRNTMYRDTPQLIWTGAGFVVTMPVVESWTPNTHPERKAYRSDVVSLAPDGTVRESFTLDSEPALHTKLAWAGDRIAITWVRAGMNGTNQTSQHFLRYLDCP